MVLDQLKALSDPTRVVLMAIFFEFELTVNELVSVLGMGQSRISRHLKIMMDASLIKNRRDGLYMHYYYEESPENDICGLLSEKIRPFLTDELRSSCNRVLEERRERTRHFFNSIAEQWTELKRDIIGTIDINETVLQLLNRYSLLTVADLGCGDGEFSKLLTERYSKVIGVDNSPEMIRLARTRFQDDAVPDFRIGAIEHLPMRDNELDCALLILVLHHLSDPQAGLAEIHRTIRDDRYFVLVDFDRHEKSELHERYGDRWPGFSRDELHTMLETCGFSVLDYSGKPIAHDLNLHIYLAQKQNNVQQKETAWVQK